MKRQFGYLILAMIMTTGCKDAGVGAGLDEVSTECSTAATCPAGHDCQDGICLLLCSDDSHCTGSEVCRDSVCVPAVCGNGEVEAFEECDSGDLNIDTGACTTTCVSAACGDNLVFADTEACDDGNLTDGDGCDSNCTRTACGNGVVTIGEECDDGNDVPDDGCEADCSYTLCGLDTADGTPCIDDGVFCNGPEVCLGGECVASGEACQEDDLSCTTVLCDETARQCNVLDEGYCLIDGACQGDLTVDATNSCQYCDAINAPTEWTAWGDDLTYDGGAYAADAGKVLGDSCGTGLCSGGIVTCDPTVAALTCSTAANAIIEAGETVWDENQPTCNQVDDDCDGEIDENYYWDQSNFSATDFDYYADFPDTWAADLAPVSEYDEEDEDPRNGLAWGRILPLGDEDVFRVRVVENNADIILENPIKAEVTFAAPSDADYDLCICWSSYATRCEYSEEQCATGWRNEILTLNTEMPADWGTTMIGYLDIRVKPDVAFLDASCEDWTVSWTIRE